MYVCSLRSCKRLDLTIVASESLITFHNIFNLVQHKNNWDLKLRKHFIFQPSWGNTHHTKIKEKEWKKHQKCKKTFLMIKEKYNMFWVKVAKFSSRTLVKFILIQKESARSVKLHFYTIFIHSCCNYSKKRKKVSFVTS